ncbi:hypothetical protein FOA43_001229 [Brettanomyces nanus]|uniref:Uncharacterized protein n=1 Tax=Eeniella nana TaxID=13502 RepID=A0A875S3P6_EENNA|nr:uncharacterized protein FOA43_001229 [Brettanomyces nanus]QPG73914.1 hypothetical protein FOA43_001229 [Brettanomyces nanus]
MSSRKLFTGAYRYRLKRFYSNYSAPPSYFRQGSPPQTFDEIKQGNANNRGGSKFKEYAKSLAFLSISAALIYVLVDLREQLARAKKQLILVKKNQKEMIIQMQHYKKKMAMSAMKSTQKDTLIEGKMQMHIALLRKQLKENGIDPVSIDKALKEFEDKVRMSTTSTSVKLWVPGDSELKALIPDPYEYGK